MDSPKNVNFKDDLDFSNNWGQVLGTLGQQPIFGDEFGIGYDYSYYIQLNLTPIQAFVRSSGILLPVATMFGLVMMVFNLIKANLGTIMVGVSILVHLMTTYIAMYYFYYLSPISWVSLRCVSLEETSLQPGYKYILSVIMLVYIVVIGLGFLMTSKKSRFNLF